VRLVLETFRDCDVINFDALTYAGNLDNLSGLDEERHHFVRGILPTRDVSWKAFPMIAMPSSILLRNLTWTEHCKRGRVPAHEHNRHSGAP